MARNNRTKIYMKYSIIIASVIVALMAPNAQSQERRMPASKQEQMQEAWRNARTIAEWDTTWVEDSGDYFAPLAERAEVKWCKWTRIRMPRRRVTCLLREFNVNILYLSTQNFVVEPVAEVLIQTIRRQSGYKVREVLWSINGEIMPEFQPEPPYGPDPAPAFYTKKHQ